MLFHYGNCQSENEVLTQEKLKLLRENNRLRFKVEEVEQENKKLQLELKELYLANENQRNESNAMYHYKVSELETTIKNLNEVIEEMGRQSGRPPTGFPPQEIKKRGRPAKVNHENAQENN